MLRLRLGTIMGQNRVYSEDSLPPVQFSSDLPPDSVSVAGREGKVIPNYSVALEGPRGNACDTNHGDILLSCSLSEVRDGNTGSVEENTSVLPPPLDCRKYQRSRVTTEDGNVFSMVRKECSEIQILDVIEELVHENYEVLGVAGIGSGGPVMKVRCIKNNVSFARKSIPIAWSESSTVSSPDIFCAESPARSWAQSATREIKILKRLSSPYIVKFEGAYVHEGELFTLMEYVDVGSLKLLSSVIGPVYEPDLAKIGLQILKGLDYLSTMLVVHRDIKPSNILISRSGQIKLADFGISLDLTSASDASPCMGSHGYLAPELMSSDTLNLKASVDNYVSLSPPETPDVPPNLLSSKFSTQERFSGQPVWSFPNHLEFCSDVWSFGIVLLELAMGRYPYPSFNTKIELFACIYQEDPPELLNHAFSHTLRKLISTCLTKDHTKRPCASKLLESCEFINFWPKDENLSELASAVVDKLVAGDSLISNNYPHPS